MLALYKALAGIVVGLVAFIVPIPLGGQQLFVPPTRLAVVLGIACGLLVFFLKGIAWLAVWLDWRRWSLWVIALLMIVNAALYFALRHYIDTPSTCVIAVELVAYLVLAFFLAALLAILGALAVVYWQQRRQGDGSH